MLVLVISGGAALALGVRLVGDEGESGGLGTNLWAAGLWVQGSMVLAAWIYGVSKHRVGWSTLGLVLPRVPGSFRLPWLVLVLSLSAAAAYSLIASAIGVASLEIDSLPQDALGQGVILALNAAVIGVWVPFAEEVFFRGFLLPALIPSMGTRWAVVVSSLVFALGHASPFTAGPVIPALAAGLLLSWLYIRTKSILPTIMAHSAQNLLAVTAIALA